LRIYPFGTHKTDSRLVRFTGRPSPAHTDKMAQQIYPERIIVERQCHQVGVDVMKRLLSTEGATYRNAKIPGSGAQGRLGIAAGTLIGDDGSVDLVVPAGLPPDLAGQAQHNYNQRKKQADTVNRLRAKLEAKRKAK